MERKPFKFSATHRVFKAYYEWFCLNEVFPIHIIVDLNLHPDPVLRANSGKAGDIVLNISPQSIMFSEIKHDVFTVSVSFAGVPHTTDIPWKAVRFLYSPQVENIGIGIGDLAALDEFFMAPVLKAVPAPVKDATAKNNVVSLADHKGKQ